jgi:hypothetical protein
MTEEEIYKEYETISFTLKTINRKVYEILAVSIAEEYFEDSHLHKLNDFAQNLQVLRGQFTEDILSSIPPRVSTQ